MFNPFRKSAPARDAQDAPKQPQIMYISSGIAVALVPWNDKIAASAAMRHPIVHRALDKLASSVQQVRFLVQDDPDSPASERNGRARIKHHLQSVLDYPNDEMSAHMFRYWMGLTYAVYGKIPMRITTTAMDSMKPNAMYPLDAGYVYVHQNNRGNVLRYDYGQGENKESYPSLHTYKENPTGKGYAVQFWKPGLKGFQNKDDNNTPLQSIGLPAQVIRSLLLRTIQTAEGHPNVRYLVTCSKTLTEPQKEALKHYINEDHGPNGMDAGKVPILQNAGDIKIHELKNDLSDIHSKMPSDDMARLIFGAFGIPIALAGMGAADAAKFAGNYMESRTAFWEDTVVPGYVSPIATGLTRVLCPPGLVVVPDLDEVPAMMASRIKSMKEVEDVSYLTTNEKREMFGYEATKELPPSKDATQAAPGAADTKPTEANDA